VKLLAAISLLFCPALVTLATPALPAQTPSAPSATPAQPPAQLPDQPPQTAATHAPTITVRSNLVLIPALVKTKPGALVFTLNASDFALTDDGVPQQLTLEQDTDSQPLALVIAVETGGDGLAHIEDYKNLGPLLDSIVGGVPHQVAVVGFDSAPTLLHGFTPDTAYIAHSLNALDPGDSGDAILDALAFSVDLLRQQPPIYRRAILLLSETLDHGSHTTLDDALRDISDTNTVIYTAGFNSTRAEVRHEAGKFSSSQPGPQHGCFSRTQPSTDVNGNPLPPSQSQPPQESAAAQDFNCLAELAPPLRLARMAFLAATNSLRRNTPESVAHLTGGEYYKFSNVKNLQRDLVTISNHVPNRYVLSFRPQTPSPGFHTIHLTLPDHANLVVEARNGYWVEPTPTP
jgi:VWFA-related protein